MEIITTVTDELFEELAKLTNQKVISFSRWDESLADALVGEPDGASDNLGGNGLGRSTNPDSSHVDIDLYLNDGVYFELYSVVCFRDIDSEPVGEAEAIEAILTQEIQNGLWLDEIAVDEENQLVLVLSRNHNTVLLLVVGGWTVDGWEELPE